MPTSEDFDLIDRAFGLITDKEANQGPETLSPTERLVTAIWAALGLIENGSFQYLLENQIDLRKVSDALTEISCFDAARQFLLAADLLPAQFEQWEWSAKLKALTAIEAQLDALAKSVLQQSQEIERALAQRIRDHPELFHLPPP